ncbi:MAG TPA: hypothetical protein VFH83_11710 [Spirochaetia bacterium]|nr:hypothetical protein [Spirochaetia bacterium]
MTETFRKLNYKDQRPILVLGAPQSFSGEIASMNAETEVRTSPAKGARYAFVIAFAATKSDMKKAGAQVVKLLDGDAVCWFAYPKPSSRAIKTELNRDLLWELLMPLGIRPVRQIAIDADWSALRFRAEKYVKS